MNHEAPESLLSKKKRAKRPWILGIVVLCLGLLLVISAEMYRMLFQPNPITTGADPVSVKIRGGMSFYEITQQLVTTGLICDPRAFHTAARIFRQVSKIQAGKYLLPRGLSNWELLKRLAEGKIQIERITIPEGKTHAFIASILQQKIEIDSAKFVAFVLDSQFTQACGIDAPTLEGYLYPDTYFFNWGMSEPQCIMQMVTQFMKHFPDSLQDLDPELGLTRHEMVILASIIEGEVQVDAERPIISALYRNRLKKRMLLQACPTVQYLLPEGPRRLLKKDLEIDSPYNTYIYPGLPPGPINNPGGRSLLAAQAPADVPYLYMVARGDGGHVFSQSLTGHLSAKRDFDLYRQKVNRARRAQRK
ncbi:endolytic transglycosylase MltG [candidate division KSB1 bacterium]|nr:endolytic transglycosylase MltG [candidate division KSB1 bacterium]